MDNDYPLIICREEVLFEITGERKIEIIRMAKNMDYATKFIAKKRAHGDTDDMFIYKAVHISEAPLPKVDIKDL